MVIDTLQHSNLGHIGNINTIHLDVALICVIPELIEDITDHVDRTRDRLVGETTRVRTIDRKDNTCGYWIVILILLVVIVIISAT